MGLRFMVVSKRWAYPTQPPPPPPLLPKSLFISSSSQISIFVHPIGFLGFRIINNVFGCLSIVLFGLSKFSELSHTPRLG
ncbi:hypothetical protein Cni_G06624 [Canna indica]|uniref:Uncharacterized protein n=1 Tax=Canna indica TaxID=4628 RepID=A0AAQ3K0K9_9LILI|nr:hypothetical protein Cni_G06624 [Canna indica]